jgi:hypothetical protein
MNAFAKTLSKKWKLKKMEYKWFPQTKSSGNKRGRLTGQSPKAAGTEFDLFYFLYVDNGAMLFNTREELTEGTQLLFDHFARFELEMHIGNENKNRKRNACTFQWTKTNQQTSEIYRSSRALSLLRKASNTLDQSSQAI